MDSAFISLFKDGIILFAIIILSIHLMASAYHWFRYGTKKSTAMTALILYGVGGLVLILIMLLLR